MSEDKGLKALEAVLKHIESLTAEEFCEEFKAACKFEEKHGYLAFCKSFNVKERKGEDGEDNE